MLSDKPRTIIQEDVQLRQIQSKQSCDDCYSTFGTFEKNKSHINWRFNNHMYIHFITLIFYHVILNDFNLLFLLYFCLYHIPNIYILLFLKYNILLILSILSTSKFIQIFIFYKFFAKMWYIIYYLQLICNVISIFINIVIERNYFAKSAWKWSKNAGFSQM